MLRLWGVSEIDVSILVALSVAGLLVTTFGRSLLVRFVVSASFFP